jgi:hypothetical protein
MEATCWFVKIVSLFDYFLSFYRSSSNSQSYTIAVNSLMLFRLLSISLDQNVLVDQSYTIGAFHPWPDKDPVVTWSTPSHTSSREWIFTSDSWMTSVTHSASKGFTRWTSVLSEEQRSGNLEIQGKNHFTQQSCCTAPIHRMNGWTLCKEKHSIVWCESGMIIVPLVCIASILWKDISHMVQVWLTRWRVHWIPYEIRSWLPHNQKVNNQLMLMFSDHIKIGNKWYNHVAMGSHCSRL